MTISITPVAFIACKSEKSNIWCITPVYKNDWFSDISLLFHRQNHILVMSVTATIHHGRLGPYLRAGCQQIKCTLTIDSETPKLVGKLTYIAFSTEELARAWVCTNGQPRVECPVCGRPQAIRHSKSIYYGWLDHNEPTNDSDGQDFFISEHPFEDVRCDGSNTAVGIPTQ